MTWAIVTGLLGAIFGFLAKALFDVYISSKKDSLKDVKLIFTESLKNLDSISDDLNKSVFDYYSEGYLSDNNIFKILKIENDFRYLGNLIVEMEKTISNQTSCKVRFEDSVRQFRSLSTRNIHDAGIQDFNRAETVRGIHVKYLALKKSIFLAKINISLYQISDHSIHHGVVYHKVVKKWAMEKKLKLEEFFKNQMK